MEEMAIPVNMDIRYNVRIDHFKSLYHFTEQVLLNRLVSS